MKRMKMMKAQARSPQNWMLSKQALSQHIEGDIKDRGYKNTTSTTLDTIWNIIIN